MRRAVIDVGTNSVKLLVADVEGQRIQPVVEKSEQTRLGQGFYETHQLQSEAIRLTGRAVAGFAALARDTQARFIHVIGTSAARDALNKEELALAIQQSSGLSLQIISGEQEAEWVFRGVSTDPRLAGQKLLILDVGGGSTEFILGEAGHHLFRESFPLGSVRLLEKFRPGDPPSMAELATCRGWLAAFFKEEVTPVLLSLLQPGVGPPVRLVGTGGTATILARIEGRIEKYDRTKIERVHFSRRHILEWMVQLWSVSLAERRKIVGLPSKRADVIPMGAAIFEAVMEQLPFSDMCISTRGLRFGAVLEGSLAEPGSTATPAAR
jgi:exopolyphosphatase/guanosine-5'-triphosphate,3'-diphosphate pyrophosphatase